MKRSKEDTGNDFLNVYLCFNLYLSSTVFPHRVGEDFRSTVVLRHYEDALDNVETNDSDTEEDFPPPPPPIFSTPVFHTVKIGKQAEFKLNIELGNIKQVHSR